jgi:predicted CXXCH cytochrome family protein
MIALVALGATLLLLGSTALADGEGGKLVSLLGPLTPRSSAARSGDALQPAAVLRVADSAAGLTKGEKEDRKDRRKDEPVPPPSEPPTVTPPPVDPPTDPLDPPAPPEEPPAVPGSVANVACVSGNMADVITFSAPADGGPLSGFTLLRGPTESGPFAVAARASADAADFTLSVETTGTSYYQVFATGPGGSGPVSEIVSNGHVSMSMEVPPPGASLRSSNGEMSLVLPAGAFATTTTVTVEEIDGTPRGGIISLAGVYDITPSGVLGEPARLSVAYTVNVEHFQVVSAMLAQAGLMTWDGASWASAATNVAVADGMVSGDLAHFSYWTGALVQPHGTSTTAYCADGAFCHNLTTYPDSATRLAGKDPQVCFNCHGSESLSGPPAGAPADSENVQHELDDGNSRHPIAIGDLACTTCHDPHADPTQSPGLLRVITSSGTYLQGGYGLAPGIEFCWTCHGTAKNRRIDYLVPGYWANSGGDKQTGFNGAHTATRTSTVRLDTADELARGYADKTQVQPDGTVTIAQTNILLPKTQTPVPVPAITGDFKNSPPQPKQAYDGDTNTKVYWSRDALGATGGNGYIGTGSLTVDLGSPTQVTNFECVYLNNMSCVADVLEIQTSNDGATWSSVVSQGTVGTHLWTNTVSLTGTGTGRYVRFVFTRDLSTSSSEMIAPAEISIYGLPSQGTYEVRPDIARKATFTSGVVRWQGSAVWPATMTATMRASLNSGTTWTGWQTITNGGAIPAGVIASGSSLENALMQIQFSLAGAPSPAVDWVEVGITRGAVTGSTPTWSGDSEANQCKRCHVSHASPEFGLVIGNSTAVCTNCHSATYGASYGGAAQFNASVHRDVTCNKCHTAHGNAGGTGNSYPFLLKDSRPQACLSPACHPGVKDAIEAKQGPASEWAKHDLYPAEQVQSGSKITCKNCHSTHISPTGLVNPDNIASAFTAMIDDPTSIPTAEAVIYASKDALLDSTAGQQDWNYGASTTFTLTPSNRALLYFDLGGIPAGSTIQNATLYLWKTSPGTAGATGSYKVYPASRDWLEGTGTGTLNSASVNGATWLEWQYGDNANTGSVVAGDWQGLGGDYAASPTVTSSGLTATNVTSLVQGLYAGTNYGLMLTDAGSTTSLPFYTRHNADAQYQPRLRIVYQTGPATRQVVDDITFCTKCHDGSMPLGLSGQSLVSVGSTYAFGAHGGGKGLGPESDVFGYWAADQGGGGLKAPYSYGMDALPCTTCHDPHGSRLPYHLREVVNGSLTVGIPIYGYDWGYGNPVEGDGLGYFCAACHIIPSSHLGYTNSISNCSSGCHNHAGR